MNTLYNNQEDIAIHFKEFLKTAIPDIRLTQLKIIPYIIIGMILSESCVASDIANSLKGDFSHNKKASNIKRIRRFFANPLFKPYEFYQHIIIHVLANYAKKHDDKRVHITFDHMFSHDNYTVFMMTMRIGLQSIPLWFKCYKGGKKSSAFKIQELKNGITAVSNLFKNTDLELIFLADRYFGSVDILSHINSLGHTYCIRLKGNILVEKDGKTIQAKKLKHRKYHSVIHENISITKQKYQTNIVYSSTVNTNDPWIIVTNGDPKRAIKDYSYRFGAIECLFKSQKSNGFHLEKVSNASLQSFTAMYTCICVCDLYLTIVGTDFSKNSRCYKNVDIETHKTYIQEGKRIKKRVMSLFNTGLTLFKLAFNSEIYIRLPFSFKLYDI